jgi:AcrR family transcriptional regulator
MAGTRAERKQATRLALRRAAVRLVTERGYEATSTDDIARAAGVSPRTFFNYFPSKESALLLPEDFLPNLVREALRRRPPGEDVVASLAAIALDTATSISAFARPEAMGPLMLATLRLMFTERPTRQIFLERRAGVEEVVWDALRERGVAAEDLGARAAVTSVVALTYLALRSWVEEDGAENLVAVVARCLLHAPDPGRLATGVTSPRPPSPTPPTSA